MMEKMSELNKAREETMSYVAKKDQEYKVFDKRLEQKNVQIDKQKKQLEEMDNKNVDANDKITALEQDKKNMKLDFDSQRKFISDRITNLDSQLFDEMQKKKGNQEKMISMDKTASSQNVEITTLKVKQSELQL